MSDDLASYDTYLEPAASQALATALMAPVFVGWLLHIMLFGCLGTLAFQYMHTPLYKKDPRRVKGTNQHRDTNTLLLSVTPLDSVPYALTGTIALITQLSLAERASKFFINRCTALNGLFSAGSTAPIVTSVYGNLNFIAAWSFLSAGTDAIITISLVLVLRKEQHGVHRSTHDILSQLISLTMRTGAMTTVFALTCSLVQIAFRDASVDKLNMLQLFAYPLSALYVLSFLTTLSSRGLRTNVTDTTYSQTDNHASKHPQNLMMGPYHQKLGADTGVWTETGTKEPMPEGEGRDGLPSVHYGV
ncbi:hypothetical protein RQP46_004259 [Phenoliferia psychrophenolica]